MPERGRLQVAVASNFAGAAEQLAAGFEARTGRAVALSFGSTGKHYAQIHNGAPFDLFLAADRERPERLEREGLAAPDSRFTYALGRLALYSAEPGMVDAAGEVLDGDGFQRLAIANPRLAPYGAAAVAVLEARGRYRALEGRLVLGENIAQTYQFVASGSAELGFVARSQILRPDAPAEGSWWVVPAELHPSIEQQAVRLSDRPGAAAFLAYLRGEEGRAIIRAFGYDTP